MFTSCDLPESFDKRPKRSDEKGSPTGDISGRWKLVSLLSGENEVSFTGASYVEFKDGKFVSIVDKVKISDDTCSMASTGTYEQNSGKLTTLETQKIGAKECVDDDYNPEEFELSFKNETFSIKKSKVTRVYRKESATDQLVYETIAAKFESVSLEFTDPDKAAAVSFVYRNPKAKSSQKRIPISRCINSKRFLAIESIRGGFRQC